MQKIIYGLVFFFSLFLTSCFQDEVIIEDFNQEIEILPTAYESRVDFPVTLLAITKTGIDVTNEVKFIINNVEQVNNVINSNIVKTFTILAKYKEKLSSPIEVKFSNSVSGFKKMF